MYRNRHWTDEQWQQTSQQQNDGGISMLDLSLAGGIGYKGLHVRLNSHWNLLVYFILPPIF